MPSLSLSQSLCLAQRSTLNIELALSQSLALAVSKSRPPGSPGNPGDILAKILHKIADVVANKQLQSAVQGLAGNKSFVDGLLSHREDLAVLRSGRLEQFAADHIYTTSTQDGKFIHATDGAGKPLLDPPKTTGILFRRALLEPEGLEHEMRAFQEMMQSSAAERVTSLTEHSEMITAQNVAKQIRPFFENFCALLELVFAKKAEGEVTVAQFLREAVILDQLDLVMSERLIKRFVRRFKRVGAKAQAGQYEEAMLNTIAEYTLISMGVISPDIFTLQRGEVDTEALDAAETKLSEVGIDLNSVLAHYDLKRSGNIFWYRYATTKMTPGRASEHLVRGFITDTVRKDRDVILAALGYEEVFEQIRLAKAESNLEDFPEVITEGLTELLGGEKFQKAHLALLRKWYPRLEQML